MSILKITPSLLIERTFMTLCWFLQKRIKVNHAALCFQQWIEDNTELTLKIIRFLPIGEFVVDVISDFSLARPGYASVSKSKL